MNEQAAYIKNMLSLGQELFQKHPRLNQEVGTVNIKGDRTIGMDTKMEEALIEYVKNHHLPYNIFSEEIGFLKLCSHPEYILVFDPLDGSTNYKIGKNLFPYGLLIALYRGEKPKLNDIVAAGALEHTTGSLWVYDGTRTVDIEGNTVNLDKEWEIHRSTPVNLDLYYHEAYETFLPLAGKLHIKWGGSNISSLLYVLTQTSALMGARLMRPEEIGAIVSLVKGAGGITVDHSGNDLGEYEFSPDKTYQLLAGNKKIVMYALSQIR
jgi:fructose-1,6-bisphosphatase/inositol monophosphatase family enzyme